jgi:phosphoenolpyruvate carboxykinase (GTP)
VPRRKDIDVAGLNIDEAALDTLLSVDPVAWRAEVESIGKYLDEFRERVPAKLREELRDVAKRLG